MSVLEVIEKKEWKPKYEFLQSWKYGDFLISTGRNIIRLEIGSGETVEQVQCVVNKFFFGISFIYIPRAKISLDNLKAVLIYFKQEKYTFVRFETIDEIGETGYKTHVVQNRQPHYTWILNITQDSEQLLKEMHAKTRYNIRLAQKKGVQIDFIKNLELFWKLNTITTERNEYVSHPKKYIEKLLQLEYVYQVNASVEGVSLASAILLKHGETLIYFFGASSNEYRNVMAPYVLHFEIIKLAQKLGCTTYDFWGIAPPAKQGSGKENCYHGYCWVLDHSLTGVSRFKAGFGGKLKSYPDAIEVVLNPIKYILFNLIQKFRKKGIVGHPQS
ncbi:MAG: peptidoglycan bridge formation glycyltransferase FemA/FemB family protein [Candidatus Magasanikbacteria bacterium]|nr:peptidoglycan bridge formation glycyltransferase FemA/FemB family protein [Candidatus Magasanikbacteria bacterium]